MKHASLSVNQQLTLNVSLPSHANLDNFDFSTNAHVKEPLYHLLTGAIADVLFLQGGRGVGKSHLLQGTVQMALDKGWQVGFLSGSELADMTTVSFTDMVADYDDFDLLCIDDIDLLVVDLRWCEALFHLYNMMQLKRHRWLISARQTPSKMPCLLADLRSRLQMALLLPLHQLDEVQRWRQLQARAQQLGLNMSTSVAQFIVLRASRNMADIMSILQQLDIASWQAKRKLTIPFVKQVLHW
jgi:DnaA family protein